MAPSHAKRVIYKNGLTREEFDLVGEMFDLATTASSPGSAYMVLIETIALCMIATTGVDTDEIIDGLPLLVRHRMDSIRQNVAAISKH